MIYSISDIHSCLVVGNEPDHYLDFTPQSYSAVWSVSIDALSSS